MNIFYIKVVVRKKFRKWEQEKTESCQKIYCNSQINYFKIDKML